MSKAKKKQTRSPGRKRQAQVTLPQGDVGPETAAQMQGAEVIPLRTRGGDWRVKIRRHPLEWMAKPQGKRRAALITPRQRNSGMHVAELAERLEATGEAPWFRPYVDKPGARGERLIYAIDDWHVLRLLMRRVPRESLAIVNHVVLRGRTIRPGFTNREATARVMTQRLCDVLDDWADFLGY